MFSAYFLHSSIKLHKKANFYIVFLRYITSGSGRTPLTFKNNIYSRRHLFLRSWVDLKAIFPTLYLTLICRQTIHENFISPKYTGKNNNLNACFLILLKDVKLHNTCNLRHNDMEICRTTLCINICNLFHERARG